MDIPAPSRRLRPLGAAFALALLLTRGVGAQPFSPGQMDSSEVIRPAPQRADTVVTRAPANPPVLVPPDTVVQKPVPPFVPAKPEAPLDRFHTPAHACRQHQRIEIRSGAQFE